MMMTRKGQVLLL